MEPSAPAGSAAAAAADCCLFQSNCAHRQHRRFPAGKCGASNRRNSLHAAHGVSAASQQRLGFAELVRAAGAQRAAGRHDVRSQCPSSDLDERQSIRPRGARRGRHHHRSDRASHAHQRHAGRGATVRIDAGGVQPAAAHTGLQRADHATRALTPAGDPGGASGTGARVPRVARARGRPAGDQQSGAESRVLPPAGSCCHQRRRHGSHLRGCQRLRGAPVQRSQRRGGPGAQQRGQCAGHETLQSARAGAGRWLVRRCIQTGGTCVAGIVRPAARHFDKQLVPFAVRAAVRPAGRQLSRLQPRHGRRHNDTVVVAHRIAAVRAAAVRLAHRLVAERDTGQLLAVSGVRFRVRAGL